MGDVEVSCAVCAPRPKNTAVYTRWGGSKCPSGTRQIYKGWVGGAHNGHQGSGANYMCMHPEPQKPDGASTGNHNGALIYGTEYENTGAVDKNHDKDAGCVVCEKVGVGSVYVQWGRMQCSNSHKTEYKGLIMASRYTNQKSEFICVDLERAFHSENNNGNQNGALLYTTEMEGGSSDEGMYPHNVEVSCAVCSSPSPVYVRWGSKACPSSAIKLYDSFMASSYYTHQGSGYNDLCMHPQGQKPAGASNGDQNGALLYGMEYENTGAVDKNHNKDAACVVCQRSPIYGAIPYVQWGRKSCTNGHTTMYYGLIMATHYGQRKSEFVCVDWERATHAKSHNGDQNGGLLYTTELEQGSAMKSYSHDTELSCAVCTSQTKVICVQIPNCAVPVTCSTRANQQCSKCYPGYLLVNGAADECGSCPKGKYCDGTTSIKDNTGGRHAMFTRWGSRSCPPGTTKMYDGFMAGASHTHHGSGANYLCMHPEPEWPEGVNTGSQNGALLYGVEYENTGAVDKNHDQDAACVVCEHDIASTVYVQWGRKFCSGGHETVYNGVVMAGHYGHKKTLFICMDWERGPHKRSSKSNQNGGLIYTSEVENGNAGKAYGHDVEVSCAVCAPRPKNTAVYTRWGGSKCPSGTRQIYKGWVGGAHNGHHGSGANYMCMHPEPQKPDGASTGNHNGALIYGTEYENTGAVDKNHDKDAGCVVCEKVGVGSVYVQWGRMQCSNSHKTEYKGLIMASRYTNQKSEFICVDLERAFHSENNNGNQNGALLYTTEMEGGSSDEGMYPHNVEVSCAVCSSPSPVYVRWGSKACPSSAIKLYDSFMASSYYTHQGSGYNDLCMHPQGQKPAGASNGDQNGALLYGVEYENTGAVDKNHNKDAACAVCQAKSATGRIPYVQWGRKTCSNDQKTEYYGLIMATHYTQRKSEFVCVDWERAFHAKSHNGDQNGGLLYTTELEQGSADDIMYGHDRELSCALCS